MSQEPIKTVRLSLCIEEKADKLLRDHIRRRGDLSRIIENLIYKEFDAPQPTAQPTV